MQREDFNRCVAKIYTMQIRSAMPEVWLEHAHEFAKQAIALTYVLEEELNKDLDRLIQLSCDAKERFNDSDESF